MNGRVGQSTTSLTASNLVSQKWVEMVRPAGCGYSTVGTRAVVGLCLTPAAYTHYIHPLTPFSSGKHQSDLSIYESGYVLFVSSFVLLFRPHIKAKSYSIFLVWFILLRLILSRAIHVTANGKILFFFLGWVVFHCACMHLCVCVCVYVCVYTTSSLSIHSLDT